MGRYSPGVLGEKASEAWAAHCFWEVGARMEQSPPGPGGQLRGHSGIRGKSASFGGSRGCAAE